MMYYDISLRCDPCRVHDIIKKNCINLYRHKILIIRPRKSAENVERQIYTFINRAVFTV